MKQEKIQSNIKNKLPSKTILLIFIFIIIIFIVGTAAWLTWKSKGTALVLKAGDNDSTKVVLKPYQINKTIVPALDYTGEEYTNVTITNGSQDAMRVKLYYNIKNIDSELANSNFKYMITKSTDNGSSYHEYKNGNFNNAQSNTTKDMITEKINPGEEYKYRVYVWYDGSTGNNNNIQGKIFTGELKAIISESTGANMLISKANDLSVSTYETGNPKEMYTFHHNATKQIPETTDYRYIGDTPNNYITFNNEDWRIIGVFDGKIKIMRNESIGNYSWDNKYAGEGSATIDYGSNDWSDSKIKNVLNSRPYWNRTTGICPICENNPQDVACDFSTNGLTDIAKSQISETTYYLGSGNGGNHKNSYSGKELYQNERGNPPSNRSANWLGYVGLMYPSDYVYTRWTGHNTPNSCFNNSGECWDETEKSWMFDNKIIWTITPEDTDTRKVFYMGTYNDTMSMYIANTGAASIGGIKPVVYLKPEIKLKGTGTQNNPYKIADSGADMLINKSNDINVLTYDTGNKKEMYAFHHNATTQTPETIDYRYIGNQPNNYIRFNDEDWRIIGVFDGYIKIMKQDSIGNFAWTSSGNNWIQSSLKNLLNSGDYYNRQGAYSSNGLTGAAKTQIAEMTYYLGGHKWRNDTIHFGDGEEFYQKERGTNVITGRPTSWLGYVGLMYPSDYAYTFKGADNKCYDDPNKCHKSNPSSSWMYNSITRWTMTPHSGNVDSVFYVDSSGYVGSKSVNNTYGVQPVVYLKPESKLKGTGTQSDPYKIADSGVDILIEKSNDLSITTYEAGNKKEMYSFMPPVTTQVPHPQTEYRYIGNQPNNYITFNDEDWRIIGVFDGHIKIMKNVNIGQFSYDFKKNGVGSSTSDNGSNEWGDSQLMYMLNPTTYNLKEGYILDGNYIKDNHNPRNIIYESKKQPAEIAVGATSYNGNTNTWNLNDIAKNQISATTYYLGGPTYNSTTHYGNAETIYKAEREKNTNKKDNWLGYVGLIYSSDYVYTFAKGVDDTCYNDPRLCDQSQPLNSWMFHNKSIWTITSYLDYVDYTFLINYQGRYGWGDPKTQFRVQPVVYLKPEIKLRGTGSPSNPYQIITN